ncbi:hypothetical protein GVAV_001275 [Gurleya vavrai]
METIVQTLHEWFIETKPKKIITDNGKEFSNSLSMEYCSDKNIIHQKTAVKLHKSNGRIERVIRTIRDGMCKNTNHLFE